MRPAADLEAVSRLRPSALGRRVASAALALLAFAAAGCHSPQADLNIMLAGDGGTCASPDAGVDDAGAPLSDLHCVNFLQFRVDDGTSFSTYCIKLEKRLETLCDLANVADGRELFKLDPSAGVTISVQGLRVFPATSCDIDAVCPAREIFSGDTGAVRVKDLAGKPVDLPVAMTEPCGAPEVYFPKSSDESCDSICGTAAKAVCDLSSGCLCRNE